MNCSPTVNEYLMRPCKVPSSWNVYIHVNKNLTIYICGWRGAGFVNHEASKLRGGQVIA